MKLAGLLLFAVLGWTGLGAIGLLVSLARGRRADAIRHSRSIAAVLLLYLVALLTVSIVQPQRSIGIGQDQCFDKMCFAVEKVDQVPGLVSGDASRVLRVTVRVANRGASANDDSLIRAYLVDSCGRTWQPLPGLSGNRLTARVSAGSEMLGQPLFRVADDSTALGLVLTHGHWQSGRLTIGNSDSIGHKPDVVSLAVSPLER